MRLLSHDSQMKVLKCGKSDNCFIEFIHFLAISDAKLFHSFCLCESVNVSEHFSVEGVKNLLFGKQGLTRSSLDKNSILWFRQRRWIEKKSANLKEQSKSETFERNLLMIIRKFYECCSNMPINPASVVFRIFTLKNSGSKIRVFGPNFSLIKNTSTNNKSILDRMYRLKITRKVG